MDPYMMPTYYWYDTMDIAKGVQMMSMMEQDPIGWQNCEKISDSECDACVEVNKDTSTAPKLNPGAKDFNPGNVDLYDENTWVCENQPALLMDNSIENCHFSLMNNQVTLDFVNAANYIFNDVFSFIVPEAHSEVYKRFYPSKKPKLGKSHKSAGSSYGGMKLVKPDISYNKEQLMNIAKSPLCQVTPEAWPSIAKKLPRLVRREGPTAKIIMKEVRAIKKQEEEKNNSVKQQKEMNSPFKQNEEENSSFGLNKIEEE